MGFKGKAPQALRFRPRFCKFVPVGDSLGITGNQSCAEIPPVTPVSLTPSGHSYIKIHSQEATVLFRTPFFFFFYHGLNLLSK